MGFLDNIIDALKELSKRWESVFGDESGKKDFNIGMFGPQRIGKTTMIASMVEEFKTISDYLRRGGGFCLKLDGADAITNARLAERINDLTAGIDKGSFTTGTLTGTSDHEIFKLRFEEKGEKRLFSVDFAIHDFPGGWIGDNEKMDKLDYAQWDILILPIDAAVIMESAEQKRKQAARKNLAIHQVDQFIRDWVAVRKDKPSLCIIAPVKCETYFTKPKIFPALSDKSRSLQNKVTNEYYNKMIEIIRECPNIQFLYMPVNTIGCCYLKRPTWSDDGDLMGIYAISPEPGMDCWKPHGPASIMMKICIFIAIQLQKAKEKNTSLSKKAESFIQAALQLQKAMKNRDGDDAYKRTVVLQDMAR